MKHVKLFENYELRDFEEKSLGTGKIKIGYTGDGGHGSHPSIFSKYVLENLIEPRTQYDFTETASTDNLPEALVCIYDDDWFIQPISSMVASKVIELMGTEHVDDFYKIKEKGFEILRMVGHGFYEDGNNSSSSMRRYLEEDMRIDEIQTITIIPNPKLNTIYWSDNPERSHGYWEPPYKEITMSIS